jgi:spore maturation protein CgeB
MNTLGSVSPDIEQDIIRDVAFIGHAVPPFWSPVLFGTEYDNDYFKSYMSRVANLNHHIKDDYSRLAGADFDKAPTATDIASKMQYIQNVHLYSQPHRGAVLEKVCGHDLHIFGGDPSWVHGIDQHRFIDNDNITYHKPVFDREQVKSIFSSTLVNINVTSLQFDTAVINRVMDCAAVGGFILTDRKDQLYELTSVADEISYGTIDELNSKLDYFMNPDNQNKRNEIALQLKHDLEERCSVEKVVENILSTITE